MEINRTNNFISIPSKVAISQGIGDFSNDSIQWKQSSITRSSSNAVAQLAIKQALRVEGAYGAKGEQGGQGVVSDKRPVFVAITGGFNHDGSDATDKVKENSPTEKVFMATGQRANQAGAKLDGLFIAPDSTCKNTIDTARNFVSQHRQSGEKLVIYGYSNGGRCALDVATALQQEKQSVDTLVTVDATDRLPKPATNISVDTSISANVASHHNFYQQDECGWLSCPQGEKHSAESAESTKVFNYLTEAKYVENPEYREKIHRHMEDINKEAILKVLENSLQTEAK